MRPTSTCFRRQRAVNFAKLIKTAVNLGIKVRDEAAFVARGESVVSTDGDGDLLGFSERKAVTLMK